MKDLKPTTNEMIDAVIIRHIQGKRTAIIAKELGISHCRVRGFVSYYKKTGRVKKVKEPTFEAPKFYQEIINLYANGIPRKRIAGMVNRSFKLVTAVVDYYRETGNVPAEKIDVLWPTRPHYNKPLIDIQKPAPKSKVVIPVAYSDFIKPITKEQLMSGRAA